MSLRVTLKLPTDKELEAMLNMRKGVEKFKVLDTAVKYAAEPIVRRGKELCPDGTSFAPTQFQAGRGASLKRSKYQKHGIANPNRKPAGKRWKPQVNGKAFRWDIRTKDTVERVVRKYRNISMAIIGPRWPDGNKINFNVSPNGREEWWWGTDKAPQKYSTIRNFLVRASDETRREQLSKMKMKLTELIDRMMAANK